MKIDVGSFAVLSAAFSSVAATHLGFNYGAFFTDGNPRTQKDFEDEFNTARGLANSPHDGFTSARLYTMVVRRHLSHPRRHRHQHLPPARIWCSAGDAGVTNELAALHAAINTYGANFTALVVGLSVGSEDLYRNSATAKANNETDPGLDPATLVGYIHRVRASAGVRAAVDWLGMDAYSYWQREQANAVDQGKHLFDLALNQTRAAAADAAGSAGGKKPVWITETGWPVSGEKQNEAVASAENAKRFWDDNVWWYTLRDSSAKGTAQPSFGIVGADLAKGPLFDISCGGRVEEPEACDAM
ncbi:GPI-anchored cell wall beta-1,3-endoglucanase EglC [Chaetomium strumarium]|uniref:Probable glucan endo-1,3-beta-glucosidase eglC n=1 Tax=Chaetomium strumarium TaxID=1170767 RepID=A0AAJ0GUU9_9PEZI|nr:GPI-anchored cell wall beta-1,3-endoglucanase EglC [Chaetomium strumarium]